MALPLITPSTLTIGDSSEWLIASTNYPAPEWSLSYVLVASGQQIIIESTQYEDTGTHRISVGTDDSAEWAPGTYSYRAIVTDITHRITIESGSIEVLPDYTESITGYDDRSFAKQALDAIEAVILNRASQAQLEYTIAGRQLKFIPPADLIDLRNKFRAEYRAEEAAKLEKRTGRSRWGQVRVRF